MDGIRSTPMQYPILGLLADKLKKAQQFAVAPGGYANPPAEILLNLLGVPAIQQTMERVAYGEPLTTGRGMTTQVRPEVAEAAMTLLPAAAGTARAAERGAMAAGRAGERMAERVVPQIMERGGMPAGLLEGLAQGSKSHIFVPATKDEAFQASKMLKSGKTEQEVWREIGVGKGVDGEWKKEISDVGSSMKGSGTYGETIMDAYSKGAERTGNQLYATSVEDVFMHPELAKSFPELMAMETQLMPRTKTARGAMSKSDGKTMFHVREDLPADEARSTMLHELQHAVQEKSNFAVGGSAKDFAVMKQKAFDEIGALNNEMRDIVRWIDDPATTPIQKAGLREQYDALIEKRNQLVSNAQIDPMEAYGHLMGEAEARLTQRRMDLTPEQRKQYFPFEYTGETGYGLDVKPENLIHMTQSGDIVERGLLGAAPKVVERGHAQSLLDYRGSHTAPGPDFGAPLHDLTGGGQMYPADVYSPKAVQYYGTGYPKADKEAFDLAKRVKGNPDAEVTMYRAVPNNKDITDINAGDWVTLSKDYAKTHGESVLGDYKIITKKVKAKDLWTNADSIHEFGYHPSE